MSLSMTVSALTLPSGSAGWLAAAMARGDGGTPPSVRSHRCTCEVLGRRVNAPCKGPIEAYQRHLIVICPGWGVVPAVLVRGESDHSVESVDDWAAVNPGTLFVSLNRVPLRDLEDKHEPPPARFFKKEHVVRSEPSEARGRHSPVLRGRGLL